MGAAVPERQTLGRLIMFAPRSLLLRGALFCLLILLIIGFNSKASAAEPVVDLAELQWQYHWGDLPDVNGKPDFSSARQWQAIAYPANPPGRNEQEYAWFRTTLPDAELSEPVIFVTSINLNVEAYLDDQLIYHFGEPDNGRFQGWPWHAIPLPEDFAGRQLQLRVHSDYTDIGLWGEAKIMARSDMLLHVLSSGLHELIIAAFSLLVAFVTLVFALFRGTRREFFYLGLFSLATAGTLIGENLAMQLVINWPLLKTYLAAVSYFSMPIFIAMLLYHWVNPVTRSGLLRRVAQCHVVYLFVAVALSVSGLFNLAIFFPIFDVLFILSLLIMMAVTAKAMRQISGSQKLVISAFAIYAVILLIDMLVAHSFLPWVDFPIAIGGLIFALVLVVISIRSYVLTNKALAELNLSLEQRVSERTARLQEFTEIEQQRRRELERQNRFSTELENFNVALQACQTVSEATELMEGRLADVFTPASISISLAGEAANALPTGQIRLQELEGGSTVVASLSIDEPDPLLPAGWLEDFVQRTAERLSVTMGNIKLREDLQRYSFEDSLTGLRNRRFFDDTLARDIQLARRESKDLSLLICDIDHFKRFNDEYGHEAGDIALQAVAETLQHHFRESDVPCRLGGEEFVVLMRDATLGDALDKAESLREAVQGLNISYREQKLSHLTISIGVATLAETDSDAEMLLRRADKALYAAKQGGRNQVKSAQENITV
jgi:diguanylate cyclase (GGDEF)-like protein